MSARDERLMDLLALQALEGLDVCDRAELDERLAASDVTDAGVYDRAAAALHIGLLEEELEPIPAGLRERLGLDAARFLEQGEEPIQAPAPTPITRVEAAPRSTPPAANPLAYLGWLAAAAVIVLWVVLEREEYPATSVDLARADLVEASGAVVVPWSVTDDEGAQGTEGDVVWSDEEQRGYMRFDGLRANDPTREQYQLWIFDAERPDAHPVDGGVFDVGSGGEVVVPIDPKLQVARATLFAVTLEQPGGVVVSSRERLLLTAAVP